MFTIPTIPNLETFAIVNPVTPPKVSVLDKIFGIGTKVVDFANKGVSTYSNINNAINPGAPQQNASNPAANYTYQAPGSSSGGSGSTQVASGLSTGAKVGIGVTVAAVAAGLVALATRGKKKGLSGLGDLNTAKTKAGKVKQRKAVFAKLTDDGKTYPKNKNGVRIKRKKKGAAK